MASLTREIRHIPHRNDALCHTCPIAQADGRDALHYPFPSLCSVRLLDKNDETAPPIAHSHIFPDGGILITVSGMS